MRLLKWFDENSCFNFVECVKGDGLIARSIRFDTRNEISSVKLTSLILDSKKR